MLLRLSDGKSFGSISPFRIRRDMYRLVGDVESARPIRSGALLVKVNRKEQALSLLDITEFLGLPAEAEVAARMNTVQALCFAPSLSMLSEEELAHELRGQGVTEVERFKPKKKRSEEPSHQTEI